MIKSIQAEDKGTYICTIKQPRASESSSEKSQSINVMVIGKMEKKKKIYIYIYIYIYLSLDVLNRQYKIRNCQPRTACSHWYNIKRNYNVMIKRW